MISITKGHWFCRGCALAVGCAGGCAKLYHHFAIVDQVFFTTVNDCYAIYIKGGWWGRLERIEHPRMKAAVDLAEKLWNNGELIPKSEIPRPGEFCNPRRCVVTEAQVKILEGRCTITKQAPPTFMRG